MRIVAALAVVALAGAARAEPPAIARRRRDATWREILRGPFTSSRLFAMPTADVVGPYRLTLSEDGSLLQEPGVLSSAGVIAIGFGDLAQLEYRHTSAISVTHATAPVPSAGVQLKLPLPEGRYLPAFAVAFRLGVPRQEGFGAITVDETVTDLYAVGRLRLEPVTLHAGVRLSSAKIDVAGAQAFDVTRRLILPAAGFEIAMNDTTRIVGELGLAPSFRYVPDAATPMPPVIDRGLLARFGIRWRLAAALTFDASVGYQLEVADAHAADGLGDVVAWDIRLGAEVVVPWGAIACRAAGLFCE
jgi:hypothetical protein